MRATLAKVVMKRIYGRYDNGDDDVGKTVLSRSLEVVNLSGFLKEEVVLCFMVGFVFITSISGCF